MNVTAGWMSPRWSVCLGGLNRPYGMPAMSKHGPVIGLIHRAAKLYRGSFLGSDDDIPWATALTDRIRRRLLRQLLWVGQNWEERKLAGSRTCL